MKNIFITHKIPDICEKLLKEKGYSVKTSDKDQALSKEELIKELQNNSYDALITLLTDKIDKEVLSSCKSLKVIGNYAVGFNNIDTAEAEKLGIKVLAAKGTSATAVAQHVVALMLAVADRVVEGDKLVREQKWQGWDPNLLMGKDVFSKTLGLVGCGNIGQKVAEIVSLAFGCKILYHDVNKNQLLEEIFEAKKVELDELLKTSDIVSLHVPLLPETTHLINKEKLNLMKKNCILINTARGPVVDEKALTQFLKENSNFGAGLDVFELEPKVAQELRDLPNVVFTPHIASAKESARIEMAIAAAQNVINILG